MPEQLNDLVEVAISESERFYPAFQYVVWAGKTPADALTASILETVGEACAKRTYEAPPRRFARLDPRDGRRSLSEKDLRRPLSPKNKNITSWKSPAAPAPQAG